MRAAANGIDVTYHMEGPEGAPVVMLSHSLATSLEMWQPQAELLRPDFRVLRYDSRGHGGTAAAGGDYTIDMLVEDAHALMLTLDIRRVHFMGLSMGGMVGQGLAVAYPDAVASLILASTTSQVPAEARPVWDERIRLAEAEGMEAHVEATVERWFTAPFRAERQDVIDAVRAMIRATPVAGFVGCCRAIRQLHLTEAIGAIVAPTLILVGEEDQGTPVAAARLIHEAIAGSRLTVIEAASHLLNMERPAVFDAAVAAFLADHA